MPVAEEYERHRAYLDRVASTVEATVKQLPRDGGCIRPRRGALGEALAMLLPRRPEALTVRAEALHARAEALTVRAEAVPALAAAVPALTAVATAPRRQ